MRVIDAAFDAVDALRRNPVPLLGAGAAVAVGGGLAPAANQLPIPLLAPLLGLAVGFLWFFVEPFVAGGLLGMADEALDGETDFDTLTAVGRERYVELLVARGIVVAAQLAYGFAMAVVILVVGLFVLGASASAMGPPQGGEPTTPGALLGGAALTALAVIGLLAVLGWLVQAVVGLFLQFYAVEIVLEGAGVIDGFTDSAGFTREHLGGVVAYSVVVFLVRLLAALPLLAVAGLRISEQLAAAGDPAPVGATAGSSLLLSGVSIVLLFAVRLAVLPLLRTYHVAAYREIEGGDGEATPEEGTPRTPSSTEAGA